MVHFYLGLGRLVFDRAARLHGHTVVGIGDILAGLYPVTTLVAKGHRAMRDVEISRHETIDKRRFEFVPMGGGSEGGGGKTDDEK